MAMEGDTSYCVGLAPRCQQMSFIEQMLQAGHGSPGLRISTSPESIGPALQMTVLRLRGVIDGLAQVNHCPRA